MIRSTFALLLLPSVAVSAEPIPEAEAKPVPEALREKHKLDAFYQKWVDAEGLPVLGSKNVSDNALREAAWIIQHLLDGRKDIREAMIAQNLRAVIMAKNEYTTDVPEHQFLKPKLYWDRRARGLGATPRVPVVSGGEENLLNFHRDPYPNENIFLHEFAHAIHGTGLNKVDPTFDRRLKAAHQAALDRGLWKNTYAATNPAEYWAEGVQSWFDDNAPPDSLHNDIRTREKLKAYDIELAKLCTEVFGDKEWRYSKPKERKPDGRAHLKNYDPKNVPTFSWRDADLSTRPNVSIQTALGDFEVELDPKNAKVSATNFLRVALDGGFHSGKFERFSGGGVWASVNETWKAKWAKELKQEKADGAEPTMPADGTIALVREESGITGFVLFRGEKFDVGTAKIVIVGTVRKGKDIVAKLFDQPTTEGRLTPPVDIRRVIRNE